MSQGSFGKVCAIVGDDAMWYAIPSGDVGDESYGSRPIKFLDWLGLYPLGELIHSDKQMSHAATGCLEWPHHIQTPNSKGPSNGNSLECKSWQAWVRAESLASLALLDQLFGVF